MNNFKKLTLILICFAFAPSIVKAQLNIIVSGTEARVISCDLDAEGIVEIPSDYRGYPVTEINSWAFQGRNNITGVIMPDTVTKIGVSVFRSCNNLKFVEFSKKLKSIPMMTFESTKGLIEIELPNNIEYINKDAFNGCSNLHSVKVGESCKYIGNNAFLNCESLENVYLKNVRTIGHKAFYNLGGIKKLNLESIQSISDKAFYNCKNLESISLGPELAYIGIKAFYNCLNLKELSLNNENNCFLSEGSFQNCIKIKKLNLNIERIPKSAFENCSDLKELIFSPKLKMIDDRAFFNCISLTKVFFNGDAPNLGDDVFTGIDYDILDAFAFLNKKGFSQPFAGMFINYLNPPILINLIKSEFPFSLTFKTESDSTYIIEASHDLKKWGEIGEVQGTGSSVKFIERRKALFPKQYYRLKKAD